jgi:hypothetical protein
LARDESVFHLMGKDKIVPAQLTEGAKIEAKTVVVYPAEELEE